MLIQRKTRKLAGGKGYNSRDIVDAFAAQMEADRLKAIAKGAKLDTLIKLCKQFADDEIGREEFWDEALALKFKRAEIAACRTFIRIADDAGMSLVIINAGV